MKKDKPTLMSRDKFRESVFARDSHRCVICGAMAVDAHHIMERKLFADGGYYVDNGASLCETCHRRAEGNEISCLDVRTAAGIATTILPPNFDPQFTYDKWGKTSVDGSSRKYGRTYHYPFSPGATSDDKVSHGYWDHVGKIKTMLHTEKLDGEQTCVSRLGVFARSHSAPTTHWWADYLKARWGAIKNDLGDLEIFGENLLAIHSIEYERLEDHFFVFGIRSLDKWLSWEETKEYAAMLDLAVVPETSVMAPTDEASYEEHVVGMASGPSQLGSMDAATGEPCGMEGIVGRDAGEFDVHRFGTSVFKYVRKDHVRTDERWSSNPRRATLARDRAK